MIQEKNLTTKIEEMEKLVVNLRELEYEDQQWSSRWTEEEIKEWRNKIDKALSEADAFIKQITPKREAGDFKEDTETNIVINNAIGYLTKERDRIKLRIENYQRSDKDPDDITIPLIIAKAGGDPNIIDNDGKNVFHYAAMQNLPKNVQVILDSGGDPNIKDKDGNTPLDIAIKNGHKKVVEVIKSHMKTPQ